MTQAPTISRIQALDVVNLYRLIREQGEYDRLHPSDEVSALSQVLDAVVNGFGLVAVNKANRLVATIGFAGIRNAAEDLRCELIWSACLPSYRHVVAELLDLAARAARLADIPVVIPTSLPFESPLIEAAEAAGFRMGRLYWTNKKKNGSGKRRVQRESVQSG